MAEQRVQRRLAAIMVADVVGYSRLMEADETGTLAALKERRTVILQPTVRTHGGRVVKVMGDGVLIEFASAVNAVTAAVELQAKMAEANEPLPENRRIVLRIGINLGDVVGEGSDVYGDGVNIAARLETLAVPGGVCISSKVHDEVRGKVDAIFEDGGVHELKNIAMPVRIYLTRSGVAADLPPSPPPSTRPSIAVLPFTNMSGDADHQYFSDGITEDIITELSRFQQMHVVSRNSSSRFRGTDVDMIRAGRELGVHYLLEGSVRRMAAHVRITVQLIDAATGNHIWAERYDSAQDEIFDVQDRVVRTIVGTLAGRMNAVRTDLAQRKPPASLAAYDYVLRGDALPRGTPEAQAEARLLFEKAIEIDPGYARAYALLSLSLEREWFQDMSDSNRLRDEAFDIARKAVTLDENDTLAQLAMGWAQFNRRAYELAEQHFMRALALNRNLPSTQASLATYYNCLGESEKAIACLMEAKSLDPFFTPSWYWAELGVAHFITRRYGEAIASLRRSTALSYWEQAWLTASYALADKPDLARDCAADLLRRMPEFSTARYLAKEPLARADDRQHLADGLRKAGLPE
jgi:TolB-like protein/class 3 adenylate cyclase